MQATSRLRKNVAYFKMNYMITVLVTVAASFLLHPTSLFVLAAVFGVWIYTFIVRQASPSGTQCVAAQFPRFD